MAGPRTASTRTPVSDRRHWVRKRVRVDQRKLNAARRALGAISEAAAIDTALDFIAFHRELMRGIVAVRAAGGIDDAFEAR